MIFTWTNLQNDTTRIWLISLFQFALPSVKPSNHLRLSNYFRLCLLRYLPPNPLFAATLRNLTRVGSTTLLLEQSWVTRRVDDQRPHTDGTCNDCAPFVYGQLRDEQSYKCKNATTRTYILQRWECWQRNCCKKKEKEEEKGDWNCWTMTSGLTTEYQEESILSVRLSAVGLSLFINKFYSDKQRLTGSIRQMALAINLNNGAGLITFIFASNLLVTSDVITVRRLPLWRKQVTMNAVISRTDERYACSCKIKILIPRRFFLN